jgi:exopolysaccharide production protein ExoQ
MTPVLNPTRRSLLLLPGLFGFFLSSRSILAILWFSQEPQQASITSVSLSLTFLAAAAFATIGSTPSIPVSAFRNPVLRCFIVFFGLNFASLFWTEAPPGAAAVYLIAWIAEIATIWLLLRDGLATKQAAAVMKGYVWGASAVCAVAWCLPTLPDLRLGNVDLFHPNAIGLTSAIGALIAMHLSHEKKAWRLPAFWLVLTLIRTISKTSIVAFLIAFTFYLFRNTKLSRATKIKIGLAGVAIIASLSAPLTDYFQAYSESTDPSTLTGRTVIWASASDIAIEKPLFGHGFYSFRFLIPPIDTFEAQHAHNELLQQFFTLGSVGVIVVIALYVVFFMQIRRAPRSDIAHLAAALLIFALLHGITDTLAFDLSYPLWLMAMLSILLAAQTHTAEKLAVTSLQPVTDPSRSFTPDPSLPSSFDPPLSPPIATR